MRNWTFQKWNNSIGWFIFVISAFTFLNTIEPNFSFWDCGEYISSASKLQVTHAPGAALFQLMGALVSVLAFGNGHYYSVLINAMSAIFSALTVLFLFWTITHLVRRMFHWEVNNITKGEMIVTFFAGVIGALCFGFSDTFWFSAVEGEVYASASLFIAIILWFICKWEEEYKEKNSDRWLILIFFFTGLSLGIHMMCMLVIPAVCLIYYTRKYKFTWKSFLIANLLTLVVLGIVFKGLFPAVMWIFGKSEIMFVNGFGLPFHSGTIFMFILLIGICYFIIKFARNTKNNIYQTAAFSIIYMLIGFSCWLTIPIRANANPPMNLNDPDNALGMKDYYNRVQYGDWPTIYGANYTAYLDANGIEGFVKTGDTYEKDEKTGRYIVVGEQGDYKYNPSQVSFMPRMFSSEKDVMANYITMYGAPNFTFNYGNDEAANSADAQKVFDGLKKKFDDGTITVDDYLQVKPYNIINVQKPTLGQNLDYFFSFQNGYYFIRYLLWNFVGRQNDLQGQMENTNGNWISGISFIDDYNLGSQKNMPAKYHNESTVAFFFIPFILGLIGFFFQLNKDFGRFYAILSLFILTSVGIIFYTGMKPFEVRERDYALVGSFYAFTIWIGLGVAGILYLLQKKVKNTEATLVVGVVLLGVPFMMGFQNYNPHDRSKRYTAYDFAYSALKSVPKNDIFFVYGDNDTFPIWGIQETERFRDDIRVTNFTLMATTWYVDQIKRRVYNSMPLPSSLTHEEYRDGVNDQVYLMGKEDWKGLFEQAKEDGSDAGLAAFGKYLVQDSMTVQDAIKFIKWKSPAKDAVLQKIFGEEKYEKYNFLPVKKLILPVNVNNAVASGIISAKDASQAVKEITIDYEKSSMMKNDLMMLDILANFDWKRPINFSVGGSYDSGDMFYLNNYLQFDGFSYRLVPINTPENSNGNMGRVDADDLYKVVKNYRWGNFKDLHAHFDETCTQNIMSYRATAARAAEALVAKGDVAKANEVLDLASREIPIAKYNDPRSLSEMVYGYIIAGQPQKGLKIADEARRTVLKEYDYYSSLSPKDQRFVKRQMSACPLYYSIIVSSVVNAYEKVGNKTAAVNYINTSLTPIDKRYDNFIKELQLIGKEKAYKESENLKKIMPFYQYLFQVMKPYDSTYAGEKMDQIAKQMMKATN